MKLKRLRKVNQAGMQSGVSTIDFSNALVMLKFGSHMLTLRIPKLIMSKKKKKLEMRRQGEYMREDTTTSKSGDSKKKCVIFTFN